MNRLVLAALLALPAIGACVPGGGPRSTSGYTINALDKADVIPGALDGRYFSREITDERGLAAIELVYCPMVPGAPTVCRTAVVWARDTSALLESPQGETR